MSSSFPVAILEYRAQLHHLCPHDIDHLLGRSLLEGCVVTISSGEVEEKLMTAATTDGPRPRRDLSTLEILHVHEGKMVAVCMCLSHDPGMCLSHGSWVIYIVQDLAMAASLYVALEQAAPQRAEGSSSGYHQHPVSGHISSAKNPCSFPTTMCILTKPGLESQELTEYFKCSVAKEKNETLIHVECGTCLLPSCSSCGIEAGLFVSNSSWYLVEVVAHHPNGQVSWQSTNPPLRLMAEASLDELCQLTVGPHRQYILVESSCLVPMPCFVIVPHTSRDAANLVHQIRAALDVSSIPHKTAPTRKLEVACGKERNVVQIVGEGDKCSPGVREDLVRDTLLTKTAKCDVVLDEFEGVDSEADLKQASSKVAINH